jgi:hypothetical protein
MFSGLGSRLLVREGGKEGKWQPCDPSAWLATSRHSPLSPTLHCLPQISYVFLYRCRLNPSYLFIRKCLQISTPSLPLVTIFLPTPIPRSPFLIRHSRALSPPPDSFSRSSSVFLHRQIPERPAKTADAARAIVKVKSGK